MRVVDRGTTVVSIYTVLAQSLKDGSVKSIYVSGSSLCPQVEFIAVVERS